MNAKLIDSETLRNVTQSERQPVLVAYLQEQIAKLVGIEPSDVEEQQPLQYLGIDSLIAVKLRNRLRKDLAVDISAVKFMADASLADLVVAVSQLLNDQSQTSASNTTPQDDDTVPKSYPLTYGQQGLWFLFKLVPDSAAYNIAFTARICSSLNIEALQTAVQKLVNRHPTLRTIFKQQDGEPYQVIKKHQKVEIQQIDAATWNWEELKERAIAANREPFDLEHGVLLRVNLFVCAPQDYVLLLSVHHIAIDGFSLGMMLDELRSLYEGEITGQNVTLAPIERQYGDFVRWQREMIASAVGEAHWNYWQQQLGGELPILKMPVDHPRPMVKNQRGASYTFELDEVIAGTADPRRCTDDHSLTEGLRRIAKEQGATLYMTLLATFQVLLYRYTGQSDIIVGSPAGGRSQSEFERTVGFFLNMLALRVKITGNLTFSALLAQVRQTVLAALAHQDYPSALLIERLQVNHDATLSGLFQVTFNLLKLQDMGADYELSVSDSAPRRDWGGLSLEPFVIPQQEGQYDLGLDLMETSESIFGIFRYDTDLFEAATIGRLAGHFQNLLSAVVENSDRVVGLLPMLGSAEKQQVAAWNSTQRDFNSVCFGQLFEAQVKLTPDAVAVVFEQQQLTYGELNRQADRLAQRLQALGIKPDGLVAICLDRSLEMLVALLGVLKAGGAYVPLDPAYPQERLAYILADSGAKIVLTQRHIVTRLQQDGVLDAEVQLLCLDENWSENADSSVEPIINNKVQPENLAYLIYTSGSTGKPKGVCISHQSLVNFLLSMKERPGINPEDIMLAVTTLSFDIAALELYLPLIVGARVIIASREVATSGQELGNLIQTSGTTILQATPATYQMLLAAGWNSSHKLKILCGGSELPPELAEKLQQNASSVWNMYGPTEATIWSTVYQVTPQDNRAKSSEPIGKAIANTQVYILDSYLQQVPMGVTGELYIGGAGLARGYHNLPELTQKKFITNPFSVNSQQLNHALLYKTGDLARYNADGNIEFLGRVDHQVKIRGFRIELGEIEAAIATHPQVQAGVVIARSDTEGIKYLAAYVTSSNGESVSRRQLRSFLQQKLPEYMIPGFFVVLEAFPLTPNGKIDRRALPTPDLEHDRLEKFVPPRTPTEAAIAEIMGAVLQLDRIGIYDNFFELGGHSLLATQVISRLQRTFRVELPTRSLFESPTVAELEATVLAYRQGQTELTESKIIPRRLSEGNTPLSPAQGRLWYLEQLSDRNASYNMFLAVEMEGELIVGVLEQALAEIVRRHEVLRTRFELVDDVPVQIIEPRVQVTIAVVDCQASQVHSLAQTEANQPFALHTLPLLQVKLLRLNSSFHVLLLTAHHIISDAWSLGLLIQELSSLYQAFLAGKPSPLPELPLQYGDFAVWQQQQVRTEADQAQTDYWKQQLAGAPPLLELPTDKARPPIQTFNGATRKFYLDGDLSEQLKTLSQKTGTTLFMNLLAVFVTLLSRWSNQEDIVVGTPIARRNQEQIEDLIGFFVNTLVLRLDLTKNPSFAELLAQVRQVSLDAFDRQDVPFDRVVEAIKPERNLSYSPLFQVMFAWQNAPMGTLELPGLTLSTLEIEGETAKFDLTLAMAETETGLIGWWEYNTDLFTAETIARLDSYFQTLLAAIVTTPDQPVSQLPALLSDRAQHQLLVEWNQTQVEYPHAQCIHELFEAQVERLRSAHWQSQSPDAVALVYQGSKLTYGELNGRANQLARYLQELDVKSEVLVGICLDRSLEMIVSVLGVLKAGGAYLPLDPNYPQERLSFILDDARVSVLLTEEKLVTELPEQNAEIVLLDRDQEAISQMSEANLAVSTTPDNLAYTVYTSGSTGQAKGVQVIHRSLVNAYQGWSDAYQLETLTSHLQMASFSFDVFSGDWIRALCSGAKLVLCPRDLLLEPEKLYQLMQEEEIDSGEFVPAVLKNLVDYVASTQQNLHFLKLLVVGSDTLYVRDWQQFRRVCGEQTRLINSYGVTEATIDSTYFESTTVELFQSDVVPIGKPFGNTQVYILDKQLQPVAIGVAGELYLGGVGLSRGYLNRPDLTKEKFISNPFSVNSQQSTVNSQQSTVNNQQSTVNNQQLDVITSSALLYKTGDLAKYRPDGNIEFLGRIDNQVKVRGFRIEVGEIEAVLRSQPQVKEVVVIAREERLDNKYLAAYVVAPSGTINSHNLRELIKQKLPEYMVPGAFVFLDALPLSPNGKIDRRALPVPDLATESSKTFVAPRTPSESAIAEIMASVLKLPQVGIYDNFFELGGHSLLATQVISRLRRTFNLEFPLRRLLSYPTVEGLEKTLWELRQVEKSERSSFVPLPNIIPQPDQRYQPFPLTDIQQAYWLGRNEAFELGNVATHGYLEIEGSSIDLERLNLAWHQVVLRHDQLRMVVLADGQQQVLEEVPNYQIEVLDLHGESAEEIATELNSIRDRMSHDMLSLDSWPLFEIRATVLDAARTRLHLGFDATVGDAWSMFIILREWLQLYENLEVVLPSLELTFRDYVLAKEKLQDTPQYQRSQQYWYERLDTLPPAPELPLAISPNSIKQPQFKRRSVEIDPSKWQKLQERAKQAQITPSGLLLSSFAEILNLWSKSAKFTINLTLFNRFPLHSQVNQIMGDFTSITLLEVDRSIPNSFTESSQQIQQQLWQDLDHSYIGGLKVQRELNRRRSSYQTMPIVFTSTLGLDSLGRDVSLLDNLGEIVYSISQTSQVWLDCQIGERNGALTITWDGVEALFPAGMLDDMFNAFCNLLERLVTSDAAWSDTQRSLIPETQLSQRVAINNTEAPIREQTLHGLFISQVEACANSTAIISSKRTLTYQKLYDLANGLGHKLRSLGATPNTLVAVVMSKGWEQVVAVLGILISGAAYLPVDPALPEERQQYLLEQGQVKLIVTQSHLGSELSWLNEGDYSCLYVEDEISNCGSLELVQSDRDLAYVIYTSGSTGLPKGVAIDHRGAVNTIVDINQRFKVTAQDSILALSALNFDLSVYDIFGILAVGGTIVIPTMDALKDPASWLDLIVTHKITLWNSVPALMQMLVEYLSVQPKLELLPLRLALLSGDWLPVGLPGRISEFCLSIKVVSLGGATEASIWSICYPIEEVNPNCSSIPYGKPLTNQRFYILNELMEPCPIWVPGQLYIGGIGLALGYWQDQEKTNASFITHPVTGERLYQTGDLGRYLPNGNIEFLGRADFQVKINGYRIELGEVEATLKQHAAIQNAVVNAVGESNNKQLVGYVTMDQEITSRSNSAEAYQPSQLEGVVQDPIERIEFKLKQSGLQQIEASQTSIQLPQSDENSIDTYLKRQSYRQFLSQPISLSQFSQFLSCLQQMQLEDYPLPKYLYPSAGSLYPVQTYLLVKPNGVAGLEAGIYYYHPSHRLVLVSANSEIDGSIYQGNKIIFDHGAFSLFLIAELNAIRPMYGELAENFCLLEAGHIGQLLMQSAPPREIGLCPIGYLELSAIKELLKLQSSQVLLYSFVGGKIDLAQTKQWLSEERKNKSQAIDVQLKHHIKQKLPDYMVPNAFIVLDKIPLTANGKVDRKMLPLPNIGEAKSEFLTAPRTEIEQKIAEIIQQLLEKKAVDVKLNFFELGMDSLKLVQLRNKLQTQLEVNISMRQLLSEATNIAELAIAVVEQLKLVKIKQKTLNTELDDEGEIEIIEI